MSLRFMERHPAIRICRTCLEKTGRRRRQFLMWLQEMKKMNVTEIDESVESEKEKEKKKKGESRKSGSGLLRQLRPRLMNIILCT